MRVDEARHQRAAAAVQPLDAGELAAGLKVVDLLVAAGLAPSRSAARRLVEQGGVRLGKRTVISIDELVARDEVTGDGLLLHAGKKHVKRLVLAD